MDNILSLLNNTDTGDLGLNLYAALKGNAYAGFQVGLTVGPSFLMNVNGRIGAKIALTGDEDRGNILSTNLYLGFKKTDMDVFLSKRQLLMLVVNYACARSLMPL